MTELIEAFDGVDVNNVEDVRDYLEQEASTIADESIDPKVNAEVSRYLESLQTPDITPDNLMESTRKFLWNMDGLPDCGSFELDNFHGMAQTMMNVYGHSLLEDLSSHPSEPDPSVPDPSDPTAAEEPQFSVSPPTGPS